MKTKKVLKKVGKSKLKDTFNRLERDPEEYLEFEEPEDGENFVLWINNILTIIVAGAVFYSYILIKRHGDMIRSHTENMPAVVESLKVLAENQSRLYDNQKRQNLFPVVTTTTTTTRPVFVRPILPNFDGGRNE